MQPMNGQAMQSLQVEFGWRQLPPPPPSFLNLGSVSAFPNYILLDNWYTYLYSVNLKFYYFPQVLQNDSEPEKEKK